MTRFRSDIEVDMGRLWVSEDVLGKTCEVEREGYRVVIRIPPAPATDQLGTPTFDGSKEMPAGITTKRGLRRLMFSVYWDGPDLAADPGNIHAVARFVFKARDVVRRLARDLVDLTRIVKSQEWLSEHVQELPFTHPGGAWNDETGEPLPMVVGLPIEMIDRPAGSEIDATFVAALPAKLREVAPLPALLLADARFFARRTGGVERQRAVLLAAIATELKVKQVLRNVPPEKVAFVDIIVDSPRDVSVAAVALFDKTLQAAIGHSLRDEQKDLFKRIGRLFELRNQIAHSGLIPELQEARLVVKSAREVSDWLDAIHPAKAALLPDDSNGAGTSS